jgi:methionyl-tRNA formyltransferase
VALRIAYFGLPLAACLLHGDGHDVRVAVLAPVPGPGRRRLVRALGSDRIFSANELGARLDEIVLATLEREKPDLIVSWFWTRRLSGALLGAARLGGVGAHPSLLPRHRGPDPYYWAIDSGDTETGVTIHRLTERYDDGEVVRSSSLVIGERDAWQLARALDRPSLAMLRATVRAFASGEGPASVPQDDARATWAPEPSGDELRVDFRWPTERTLRRIRALAPVPGLPLEIEGLELTVTRARVAEAYPVALEPGEAAVVGEPPVLVLRTGDGALLVERALFDLETPRIPLPAAETGRVVERHLAARRSGK